MDSSPHRLRSAHPQSHTKHTHMHICTYCTCTYDTFIYRKKIKIKKSSLLEVGILKIKHKAHYLRRNQEA